jgi:hypothetical protein
MNANGIMVIRRAGGLHRPHLPIARVLVKERRERRGRVRRTDAPTLPANPAFSLTRENADMGISVLTCTTLQPRLLERATRVRRKAESLPPAQRVLPVLIDLRVPSLLRVVENTVRRKRNVRKRSTRKSIRRARLRLLL